MSTLVMKFGGASVATYENFSQIAKIIQKRQKKFSRIVVVVSAMGNMTNELIELAYKVNASPPRRELDMLISVGERISISLLAMALAKINISAISFTGSQCGIITCENHSDAKIIDVKPLRLLFHLEKKDVVIVAGFQGVSLKKEITTLGRGGSDTTAVALAIALGAGKVEFYKDVEGIYEKDPKENAKAKKYDILTYDEAINILEKGAKVLHKRCVFLAKKNGIELHILSFKKFFDGQIDLPGTIIGKEQASASFACYEQ